jgi:O-antigen/teichoic acid export membrane protein
MSSGSHGILRKFALLLGAQWFREVLQSVFLVVLARISSTTYGEFMLAFSIAQVVVFVTEFGLNQHLVTLLARREADKARLLAEVSVLKGCLLLTGLAGAMGFSIWQDYSPSLRLLILVVVAGVGLQALTTSFYVVYQVEGRQQVEARIRAASASLGFGYGLTTLLMGLAPVWVAGYLALETIIGLGAALAETLGRAKSAWSRPALRRVMTTARGGLIFVLMALAAILYNKNNIFFLQRFAGPEGVAQYSVTWQMVDGISALTSNLLLKNVLFPLFVNLNRRDSGELASVARNCARWLLLAALPIMFVLAVESDRLIGLIYGEGYVQAVRLQKALAITVVCSFIHNLAAYLMVSMKKERLLLGFYLAGLAFNLIVCVIVIHRLPLVGAVAAIVLTKGFMVLLTAGYCQKAVGLIRKETWAQTVAVVIAGAAFYALGRCWLTREVAEVLAMLPAVALGLKWYREEPLIAGERDFDDAS